MTADPRLPQPTRSAGLLALAGAMALSFGFVLARRASPPRFDIVAAHHSRAEPLNVQVARARERGRGRRALASHGVPWRGWRDILYRTYLGVMAHRLFALAAGAAFSKSLQSFLGSAPWFPFTACCQRGGQIRHHLELLSTIVPRQAIDLIGDQINRIAERGGGSLSVTFLVSLSLAVSLWSANAGAKAIFNALNVIYDGTEKRSFLRLSAISLLLTLGFIGFLLVAMAGVIAAPIAIAALGVGSVLKVSFLRWPALFVIATIALSILYRLGPSRRPAKWRWLSIGSLGGALTWMIGSVGFSRYLGRFADYGTTYGSLGAAVGLMMWLWVSAVAVLLGAQLNAEIEHQTARDSTVGASELPLGQRQAVMADTVGPAQS